MRILVIGGSGTMGKPLVELLSKDNDVTVVCRKQTEEREGVDYCYGNANDISFLKSILNCIYDCVVDFCWCSSAQFEAKCNILLNATAQYICLSSAAVVADGNIPLDEMASRFLDIMPPTDDRDYYEYHYEKARIEDCLINSGRNNWTIIRPHITYNFNHFGWGEFNEEQILLRAILGKKVIVPQDMLKCCASMTYGGDVALMISKLVGTHAALGQIINVSNPVGMTWGSMLVFIKNKLKSYDIDMKILLIEDSQPLLHAFPGLKYRYICDRLIDRVFSNDKFTEITHYDFKFVSYEDQFGECIDKWISDHMEGNKLLIDDGKSWALLDRISHEWTSSSYFASHKVLSDYFFFRIGLGKPYNIFFKIINKLDSLNYYVKKNYYF